MKKQIFRHLAALLIALFMMPGALAETQVQRDAAWFYPMLHAEGSVMHLLTDAQLEQIARLPSEDIHALVEALFQAVAGVEEQAEVKLWETFRTAEEKEARSEENAAYRAQTQPWLLAAFASGNRPEDADDAPMTVRPTATPAPEATPAPTAAPETDEAAVPEEAALWQPQDGMTAFQGNAWGQAFLDMLRPLGGVDADTCLAVTQAVLQRWLAELDHDQLSGINSDYQCWIYAPATPIDYPVVQCGNNSYYLDHLFNRTSNRVGTLFMDYRNLTDFRDPNTLIYGHHMRDNSMFHSLTNYETAGYYEAHPFLVIITGDEIYLLEAFAGYVTESTDHCYDIAISGEEDMRQFTQTAAKKSDFDSHVEINCRKDHLVTLSTCAYNFDNARYILIARLTLAWERPEDTDLSAETGLSE